jgi:Na+-transporting NADH:ubiquinone oxidoreductase subunit C
MDSPGKAIGMALGVALVCALLVSVTAVGLRPLYLANLEAERMAQLGSVLQAVSAVTGEITPGDVEARVVELASGRYSETLDADTYDARKAATDPNSSVVISPHLDIAGINRRAKHATVFIVRDPGGAVRLLILPVHGSGYQSTLYAFLAIKGDTSTVLALKFYEQGETPGMGGRVQDPAWEALWAGKRIADEDGTVRIGVARGRVAHGSDDEAYQVDGISGATRTSVGVHRLLRFWLGDFGFGPYLDRVRRGEG